jgi:hypothetical protein
MWQSKPWWCQPWSIVLTGLMIPTVMQLATHRLWLSVPAAMLVSLWWFVFLYWVPKQYQAYLDAPLESPAVMDANQTKSNPET